MVLATIQGQNFESFRASSPVEDGVAARIAILSNREDARVGCACDLTRSGLIRLRDPISSCPSRFIEGFPIYADVGPRMIYYQRA
jgi:hypothetical protein